MMRGLVSAVAVLGLGAPLLAAAGAEDAGSLRSLDLSGEWYVLVHYRDARSQDSSVRKFKDFGWSIRQEPGQLAWHTYPHVVFPEEVEEVRRQAMTEHLHWEPDARTMKALRRQLAVRSRAVRRKRLTGSVEAGFRSAPPLATGGLHTLSFERSWKLVFGPDRVRIEIVDSLSGTESLAGMEEATVYEIRERVSADELRGEWREGPKRGTFRMIRSRERKLVN